MFEADRGVGASRWPVLRLTRGCRTEVVLVSTSFLRSAHIGLGGVSRVLALTAIFAWRSGGVASFTWLVWSTVGCI